MAAQVVAATSGTGDAPYTVTVPAGTVDGDLLVAVNASDWGTLAQNGLPSGFTSLTTATYDGGSNAAHVAIGWRWASSEPTSYTFPAGGSSSTVGGLLRVTGAASGPVIVEGTPNPNGPTALSIVPTGTDDLLITYHAGEQSGGSANTWTAPSGMTEWIDAQADGTWTTLGVFSLQPSPNPSGDRLPSMSMLSLDNGASCAIAVASAAVADAEGTFEGTIAWVGSFTGNPPETATGAFAGSTAWSSSFIGEIQTSGTFTGATAWSGVFAGPSPFITEISADGRYFLTGTGQPILIKGDSNWSLLHDCTPEQWEHFLDVRASQGFNMVLVSLLGNGANGANDASEMVDGTPPFSSGVNLNVDYWTRVESFLTYAASKGITVLAYPIDGWAGTSAYNGIAGGWSNAVARTYGQNLGNRLASHLNVIYATGGDFFMFPGSAEDQRFWSVFQGLADSGADRIKAIQFQPQSTSLDSSYWDEKVQWSFCYCYAASYVVVEKAYGQTTPSGDPVPALMSEAHYENYGGVGDRYIRSQAAWGITSGSPGEIYGSEDIWDTVPTDANMQTTAVTQLGHVRETVESIDWWTLVPDFDGTFITGGRGTKGDTTEYFSGNTYVTGAKSDDGALALLYVPDATTTVTLDMDALVASARGTWVDPTNGDRHDAGAGPTFQRTTANDAGDPDYLLLIEPSTISEGTFAGSTSWVGAFTGAVDRSGTFAGTVAWSGAFTGSNASGPPPRNLTIHSATVGVSEWETTATEPTWGTTPTENSWSATTPENPWSTTGATP